MKLCKNWHSRLKDLSCHLLGNVSQKNKQTSFCFLVCNMFLTQTTYSTGSGPVSVTVVDVNSDNKPDIVVANEGSANVGVLLRC